MNFFGCRMDKKNLLIQSQIWKSGTLSRRDGIRCWFEKLTRHKSFHKQNNQGNSHFGDQRFGHLKRTTKLPCKHHILKSWPNSIHIFIFIHYQKARLFTTEKLNKKNCQMEERRWIFEKLFQWFYEKRYLTGYNLKGKNSVIDFGHLSGSDTDNSQRKSKLYTERQCDLENIRIFIFFWKILPECHQFLLIESHFPSKCLRDHFFFIVIFLSLTQWSQRLHFSKLFKSIFDQGFFWPATDLFKKNSNFSITKFLDLQLRPYSTLVMSANTRANDGIWCHGEPLDTLSMVPQ